MTLSIAVAARGACDLEAFLGALREDGVLDAADVDVHVAHDGGVAPPAPPPPRVALHELAPETSILRLWGVAIAESGGAHVAALDARCPPRRGWLAAVRERIDAGSPLFFGPVDLPASSPRRSRVGYLVEYAQFHSPLAPELDEVPGNNVVCARALLDDPASLRTQGFFKTFMVWRLRRERDLVPDPCERMVVEYRKSHGLGAYLLRRWRHGRCFGATRHDSPGQRPRWLCALSTVVLPVVRLVRIRRAARRRPELRAAFWRDLPAMAAAETAWSAGELAGYVAGGRACCETLD